MNFQDTWATNDDGEKFIFTVEMKRKLHQAGLPVEVASLTAKRTPAPRVVVDTPPEADPAPIAGDDDTDNNFDDGGEAAGRSIAFDEPSSIQIDPETGKYIGRIKWYNDSKGFGFLYRGAKEDVFFHKTDVIADADQLEQGTWILYDVEKTDKGLEASEVELYTHKN